MVDESLKIKMDFAESSEILKALKLKGAPVALGFATAQDDILSGMSEIDKRIRHYMMVSLARNEGRVFYATAEKHECNGGSFALGLRDLTPALKTGKFYFKLGKFESVTSSKRTMDSVPHLPIGETYATMYAPLEKTPFAPQVILIVANPWAMLKLAQSSLFQLGGRSHAEFSGIQSVCSDAVAQTHLTGKPNFSLGCDGSRTFSGIVEDEMVMGFPAEMLPGIVDAVKIITQAPGSSKTASQSENAGG
ncbi:MAG: DUF169 domain-containing protein [Halobacteriota archaeon]|jgi:uncharacterized protein (DUF169 family)